MEPHEQFARNLRRERERRGMTQEEVAHGCDLHPTEVSRLERAVREPRLSTIVRLAHALDIEPAILLAGVK